MNLNDAITALWLVKAHWSNFQVLTGEQQALQAGAWLDVCGDLELSDIRPALAQLDADRHEFPPTPGQVREAVFAARGDAAPDWDQAYREITARFHRREDDRPQLHPAIEEAVQGMGGWYDVGHRQITDAYMAQFRDCYLAAKRRHEREALTPPAVRELERATVPALTAATHYELREKEA